MYALNLGLYLLLFLFDTIVIDGFVIGSWHPAFLQLPEAMGADSMRVHPFLLAPCSGLSFPWSAPRYLSIFLCDVKSDPEREYLQGPDSMNEPSSDLGAACVL